MAKMLIHGELVPAESKEEYPVHNPANGEVVDTAPKGDARDVERAVQAAELAFPKWWATPGSRRGELVGKGARKITEHEDELARTLTLEQGKPLMESKREIRRFVHTIEHYAGLGKNLRGGYVPNLDETIRHYLETSHRVVAAIVPWNFPVSLWETRSGRVVAGIRSSSNPQHNSTHEYSCDSDFERGRAAAGRAEYRDRSWLDGRRSGDIASQDPQDWFHRRYSDGAACEGSCRKDDQARYT
jgi:succinate-semialdehyde dehydrogenase/glutarate-semialdehyde dehydrogenase